jgi:hypothetical protein
MAVRLSALHMCLTLLHGNIIFMFLVLISVRGSVNPKAYCGRKDQELKNSPYHVSNPRPSDL